MNFFAISFGTLLPGSSMNGIRDYNFFLSISAYLIPFLLKIMPERGFLIFFNFIAIFFRNFLPRAEYERNSGLKFFFLFLGLSHPLFWLNIMPERSFLIFWVFLLFLSELSYPGRVWTEFGAKIFFSLSRSPSTRFG